ncbi:ATP-dependent sacrificial sulfur transferase LarE [Methanothermococcus sp. Ax23]|uniref:ATP-dependent sacrificial sulfur transferase LarE n=1 Tax=Methanothermococcus sp. Ax23 TaxID=3156486 RepID=UPI003BA06BAE
MLMEKYQKLKDYFKGKKVIVSYSGGIDSSLVAKVSSDNAKYTLAITIDNGFFSEDAVNNAIERAKKYNINHKIIKMNYMDSEDIISKINNDLKNRCYFCKKFMAEELVKEKNKLSDNVINNDIIIVDGTNYDDLFEDRPGMRAYKEYNIKSPLAELKFSKNDIINISKYLNLDIPKKDTCLATRVLNPPITEEKLKMVERAERFLASFLNIEGYFRVRHFYDIAIIEINKDEVYKFETDIDNLKTINKKFKEIGFKKCVLDFNLK